MFCIQQYCWIRYFALQLPQELQWICSQVDQGGGRETKRSLLDLETILSEILLFFGEIMETTPISP